MAGCAPSEPPAPSVIATPEPTPELTEPPFDISEYKELVSELKDVIMETSIWLANMGNYEFNYWETLENIGGTIEYEEMAAEAEEWLNKKAEIDSGTLSKNYAEIGKKYKEVIKVEVVGTEANEIHENIIEMYKAFDALYLLVTSPSGDISDFADSFNEYSETIKRQDSMLSTLLSD